MNARTEHAALAEPVAAPAVTTALLTELHHADHIIKVMLRAMTVQQQARVGAQLEADGVAGEGMARAHERAAVIAAAAAPASASTPGIDRLREIRLQLGDIESHALAGQALCEICFEELDRLVDTNADPAVALAVVRIDALVKAISRNAVLVQDAVGQIGVMLPEGGAA